MDIASGLLMKVPMDGAGANSMTARPCAMISLAVTMNEEDQMAYYDIQLLEAIQKIANELEKIRKLMEEEKSEK